MICNDNDFLSLRDLIGRRELFARTGTGLLGMALGSLLAEEEVNAATASGRSALPQVPHYAPKAKAVIQLFQHGGPSHMDLFDPKPELTKRDGQAMPEYFTDLVKLTEHGGLMASPFKFRPHGEGGVVFSEILPHTARCADDIAVIRSMVTEHNNHEQALWHMHTGMVVAGRPTIGAWVNYALGSGNRNLPAYVVLRNDSSLPVDGMRNWSSGWLPPRYQGVHFRHTGLPVMHLQPNAPVAENVKRLRADLLRTLNDSHRELNPGIAPKLAARIASYELAARMQLSAGEALDLSTETKQTQEMYGLNNKKTESYGRRCLMARRLVERGVRYVQVFIRTQMWDTHANNAKATQNCCKETDQPAAALLTDLKQRGLLDETLVLWGGEFGRTPVSQANRGRDHHKQAFSLWMAGGGIKGGQMYGATDDLGYHSVENVVTVADFHATILHLLGLDEKQLTYHIHGRDEKLTDVNEARMLEPLLA
jgi:hypothetical protein